MKSTAHDCTAEANAKTTRSDWSACRLHQLFSEQAARTPNAIALVSGDQNLTYRELDERSTQLAFNLRHRGVGPEIVVGIYLDRGFDLVIAILGILKAGGAYLPIDLSCPRDRVAFMVEDASMPVLVTHRTLTCQLPSHGVELICLDETDLSRLESSNHLVDTTAPGNLAYIIYTSGSTGRPKGVLITHHNATRLFRSTDAWFGFNEHDVWTLFHSCAFDFSVWEIWGALLYGGRLVIVPYAISRSPQAFYELLHQQQVTVLNQTPSAFRQLSRVEENAARPESLALRYVIFGGEALDMNGLKPWFDRHGDQRPQLVNMYGITETTVHVTYRPLTKADVGRGSMIGVPIPDLELFVLDASFKCVPVGEAGELFVGGEGLARGYLNRPDLTAERFIESSLTAGGRLYRTGDLARVLPGGDIEYLGRIDQQVKIRGFRIELGEIEATLCLHPAVSESVVLAEEEGPGDKRLFAYLITRDGPKTSAGELRQHVLGKLPEYMAPASFVFVEKFPLTENGKLDRQALREIRRNDHSLSVNSGLLDDVQRRIIKIWLEVLHRPAGLDDNFFDLGGNSLLLAQVHEMLQVELGRAFPITVLFAHPTVRSLAARFGVGESKIDTAAQDRARRQRQAFARGIGSR